MYLPICVNESQNKRLLLLSGSINCFICTHSKVFCFLNLLDNSLLKPFCNCWYELILDLWWSVLCISRCSCKMIAQNCISRIHQKSLKIAWIKYGAFSKIWMFSVSSQSNILLTTKYIIAHKIDFKINRFCFTISDAWHVSCWSTDKWPLSIWPMNVAESSIACRCDAWRSCSCRVRFAWVKLVIGVLTSWPRQDRFLAKRTQQVQNPPLQKKKNMRANDTLLTNCAESFWTCYIPAFLEILTQR